MKKLNELGGAPKGANITRINGFYKSNTIDGVIVTVRVDCEAAATWLYRTLLLAEKNYKKNPAGFSNHIRWQLEYKHSFITQAANDEAAHWCLLANIWLLEKENLMPRDAFNRVVFVSEK